MIDRKIPLRVPEDIWGDLATIAARRHTDIPDLIAEAIVDLINSDRRLRSRRRLRVAQKNSTVPDGSPLDLLKVELHAASRAGYRTPSTRKARVA